MNKSNQIKIIPSIFLIFSIFINIAMCENSFAQEKKSETTITNATNNSGNYNEFETEVILENLIIPWEIQFLPDGTMLVTERPGFLTVYNPDKDINKRIKINKVAHVGEGGLLGLALHPEFKSNKWIYIYRTIKKYDEYYNQVVRFKFENNSLNEEEIIIDGIPGGSFHDGGRIAFGPDKLLYVTTGDAGKAELAQNRESLAGKILRVDENGDIPSSNPFKNQVYSYGHRNPQGLAWDENKQLWSTEHGPSGLQTGYDELNLIEAGKNYGWPLIRGSATASGMVSPVLQSGYSETWAPAGLAYWNSKLYFGGLRGATLYEVELEPKKSIIRHLKDKFGRIRAVIVGPDNRLYISTSNMDGRGYPKKNDDKIIKITKK